MNLLYSAFEKCNCENDNNFKIHNFIKFYSSTPFIITSLLLKIIFLIEFIFSLFEYNKKKIIFYFYLFYCINFIYKY